MMVEHYLEELSEKFEKLAELCDEIEEMQQEPDVEFINKGTLRDDKYE